ncbi:hypothetical protein NDU88_004059 [Pleurodeles waltl]|uniref:Uncharacterized protein n=1 Tax=Pleurodeles waltl TaxID=8319 RepID=A0AAV7WQT5_PLEWA|nr:hypothetical protein NDU88_004059 [Pleurodeles waltl]
MTGSDRPRARQVPRARSELPELRHAHGEQSPPQTLSQAPCHPVGRRMKPRTIPGPTGAPETKLTRGSPPGPDGFPSPRPGTLRVRQAGGRECPSQARARRGPMAQSGISEHGQAGEASKDPVPGSLAHGRTEDEAQVGYGRL